MNWFTYLEEVHGLNKLGRREFFLLKVSDKNIQSLIDEIESAESFPPRYHVDIYPGEYSVDVVVEISGPDVEEIKRIDLATSSKVLEICEKRGIEGHSIESLVII